VKTMGVRRGGEMGIALSWKLGLKAPKCLRKLDVSSSIPIN